jgi:N-formylmaleamate deformylase
MAARSRMTLVALALWMTALFSSLPLSALPAAPHSFRVEVVGHGRPMILIPGLASSGDTWKSTVARYKDRFECHVLTLAGFAGAPPIAEPLLASVRAELVDYLRGHHLNRPVVVGHSLGGTLALALAADNPKSIGSVIVVDGLPFFAGPLLDAKNLDEAKAGAGKMRTYLNRLTKTQWDDYIRSGAATGYMATSATDLETITRWSLDSDMRTIVDARVDLHSLDLRDDLARLTAPTLVLGTWKGLHDELMAQKLDVPRADFVQTFAAQFAKLPRLHFALSETSRHFIMFDEPSWFFAQMDAFLRHPETIVRRRGFDEK